MVYKYTYGVAGPAISLGPGMSCFDFIPKGICKKLLQGKHRIVMECQGKRFFCEFELLNQGSNLTQKPQDYEWLYLKPLKKVFSEITPENVKQSGMGKIE